MSFPVVCFPYNTVHAMVDGNNAVKRVCCVPIFEERSGENSFPGRFLQLETAYESMITLDMFESIAI